MVSSRDVDPGLPGTKISSFSAAPLADHLKYSVVAGLPFSYTRRNEMSRS